MSGRLCPALLVVCDSRDVIRPTALSPLPETAQPRSNRQAQMTSEECTLRPSEKPRAFIQS